MELDAIRQSSLLDIIFENRNKEYGAYTLRKFYNNRLGLAVFITMSVVAVFSISQVFIKTDAALQKPPIIFDTPDQSISRFNEQPKAILPASTRIQKKKSAANPAEATPQIVDDKNINKLKATADAPFTSEIKISGNSSDVLGGEKDFGNQFGKENGGLNTLSIPEKPKSSKPAIETAPDVMPQYPGGIKAFLAYLKKNLHAPDDVEAGQEISVKVKFVVNYDGQPEAFKIIESGGHIFDNEVLRVLQKMPRWVPGKTNGENVAVYYTVPVKFTSDF